MRVATISEYGDLSVFNYQEGFKIPIVKTNQILVEIKATSINPIDLMKREGYGKAVFEKQRSSKFPWILGSDVSGIVKKVGSKVKKFQEGQEIWGCISEASRGTYAEYAILYENEIEEKPKNLSFVEAASIPYVGLSTWSALIRWAGLRPNDLFNKEVFIQAGAGGVGTFAIQLLNYWGARITTTCSEKNNKLLLRLGAKKTIDYNKEDFDKHLSDLDISLDLVGNLGDPGSVLKTINILKKSSSSHYITLNHPFLKIIDNKGFLLGIPSALFERQKMKRIHSPINIHWSIFRPSISGLQEITRLVEESKIKPIIDSIFSLEDIVEAQKKVATSHAVGKVVVKVSDD